ncbi:DUF2252 family protein [Roseococcus sp.]|uniref:DUF2252 family protein n=1 Tax=Roseococcus sp. TaxID=2109646 RepID=UPI003BA89129
MNIVKSTDAYEEDLRAELGAEVVEEGLREKHAEMANAPFPFLRATYWRWAETVREFAPELMDAPSVLAVGDIHLENFGTWRDAEGRLIWGVNDHDEAATMPYALDLLRLVTSALLAGRPDAAAVAKPVLAGYRRGLDNPRPFVLDRDLGWLRKAVIVPERERKSFWDKLDRKRLRFDERPDTERPQLWPRYREALTRALPAGAEPPLIWYRSAGLGSLGRPRWVAQAMWQGDWVIREAKAMVPSAWSRVDRRTTREIRSLEIATGRYRAPDPQYRLADGIAIRRLSPNNRKINAESTTRTASVDTEKRVELDVLLDLEVLQAMGAELAAIHLGTPDSAEEIRRDLGQRKKGWLAEAAARAAKSIRTEQLEFRKDFRKR